MSSSRFGGRGHAADNLDEEKKLELDFLLARRELEMSANSNLDGRIVRVSGDAVTYSGPMNVSGQTIVFDSSTSTGSWVDWTVPRISVSSSGQQLFTISGNSVMETAIYGWSEDILESLPNIWCHKCHRGLSKSLQYGRIWSDKGKIWAQCFMCWRQNHERN